MNFENQDSGQLGFDALMADAETKNRAHRFERETGHLPDTMEWAIPFYRDLIETHHQAMLSAHVDEVLRLHQEAHNLAMRLNGGEPGILAHDDAPGNVLTRETAAEAGDVPRWGQEGNFIIKVMGMQVRIELDGLFGIGSCHSFWPGFSAHAVDWNAPFLSETGYRSFLDPSLYITPLGREILRGAQMLVPRKVVPRLLPSLAGAFSLLSSLPSSLLGLSSLCSDLYRFP